MRKSILYIVILFTFTMTFVDLSAQDKSTKFSPVWLDNPPKSTNPQHYYIVVMDEGSSLESIRNNRYINLENYLKKEVQTSGTIRTVISNNSNNAYIDFLTSIKGDKYTHKTIDEYWETIGRATYRHYTLYCISTASNAQFDEVYLTNKYGARGLWRSLIIPGWGQLHKGSKTKGGLILGGTAVFAIGIILTESQRADYMSKIYQTQNANHMRTYKTKADNMATARNICIGGASALYLYNIIDALVAPGARRVIINNNSKLRERVAIMPIASNELNGIHLTYKF